MKIDDFPNCMIPVKKTNGERNSGKVGVV